MKKRYQSPFVDVVTFNIKDLICTSPCPGNCQDVSEEKKDAEEVEAEEEEEPCDVFA